MSPTATAQCYCNDVAKDQDVHSSFPLLRLDEAQELCWYHRYQWLYGPVLFSLLYPSIQMQDVMQLLQHRSFDTRFHGATRGEVALALGLKALHVLWFFVLPARLHGVLPMLLPWVRPDRVQTRPVEYLARALSLGPRRG